MNRSKGAEPTDESPSSDSRASFFIETRPYKTVSIEKRRCLAQLVLVRGLSIAKAARALEIKYEAAKQIVREVKRTGHYEPVRLRPRKEEPGPFARPEPTLSDTQTGLNHFGQEFRNLAPGAAGVTQIGRSGFSPRAQGSGNCGPKDAEEEVKEVAKRPAETSAFDGYCCCSPNLDAVGGTNHGLNQAGLFLEGVQSAVLAENTIIPSGTPFLVPIQISLPGYLLNL